MNDYRLLYEYLEWVSGTATGQYCDIKIQNFFNNKITARFDINEFGGVFKIKKIDKNTYIISDAAVYKNRRNYVSNDVLYYLRPILRDLKINEIIDERR